MIFLPKLRDEEVVGSIPATPIELPQVKGLILKTENQALGHLTVI
ncbi:hypothetical protein OHA25_04915 [Nonomuraea sp. NBC_00507]